MALPLIAAIKLLKVASGAAARYGAKKVAKKLAKRAEKNYDNKARGPFGDSIRKTNTPKTKVITTSTNKSFIKPPTKNLINKQGKRLVKKQEKQTIKQLKKYNNYIKTPSSKGTPLKAFSKAPAFKPSVKSLNKLTHKKIDAANAAERATIDKLSGPKYTAPKPKFDKPTPEMISKAGPVKITKYKKGK